MKGIIIYDHNTIKKIKDMKHETENNSFWIFCSDDSDPSPFIEKDEKVHVLFLFDEKNETLNSYAIEEYAKQCLAIIKRVEVHGAKVISKAVVPQHMIWIEDDCCLVDLSCLYNSMHMDTDNVLPHLAFDTVSADFSHMDYLPDIFWNVSGIGLLKAYMPKKICFIRRFLFNFLVSDTRVEECQIKIPKKIFNDAWPYISTLQKHMGHRAVGNRQDDLSNKYMTEVFKLFRFSPYGHFNIKVNRIKQDETFMSVSYNEINETELDMETPDTSFEGTTTGYMDFPILRLFESVNDDLPVDKNYLKNHWEESGLPLAHNKATFEKHAEQGGLNINMKFADPVDFEKCLQEVKEKGLKHCWYKDLKAGVYEIAFKLKRDK